MTMAVLLFTDIEGSTSLWARHGAGMRAGLLRHDEVLSAAIRSEGGTLFKHTGDGCCATFESVAAAAAAAVAAQRRLAETDWGVLERVRSRMAIHVGEAEPRGDDWFGPALNRCARLMAIGHGGQVLVSGAACEVLGEALPEEFSLVDLGAHRLRDLAHPEHVWQLVAPGLEADFAALRSLDSFRGNLPSRLSQFIGREDEQRELHQLVVSDRLVTLVGPGGMGKTRLGLQAAAAVVDRFPEGAWFVELAPLGDDQVLAHAAVATIGLQPRPGLAAADVLAEGVRGWRALVLVDNCEHLLIPARELVEDVLRRCPGVHVLATSRAPLRIAGERVYQVGALSFDRDAVALFADRAARVRPGFELDDAHLDAVGALCRQLDGMPLAIELAAARMRSMTAAELVKRLSQRFRLLRGDGAALSGRHATLAALIRWSDDLLSEEERRFLRDLAVFSGGFDLTGAQAVASDPGTDELDTLDLLDSLVAQSLVQLNEVAGASRYTMLETIRQFAMEGWSEDTRASLQQRHAAHILRLAEEADAGLAGPDQVRWLGRLEVEHDNIRNALAWALAPRGDPELALRLAAALAWFWRVHSHLAEGRRWLEEALAGTAATVGRVEAALRARALFGAGLLAYAQSEFDDAQKLLDAALTLARFDDADAVAAWALHGLGRVSLEQGDASTAAALLEESIELFGRAGDGRGLAYSTFFLGAVRVRMGNPRAAEELFTSAEAALRELGDSWGLAALLTFSAAPALVRGDVVEGARRYGEALGLYTELGTAWMAAQAIPGVAHAAALTGRWRRCVSLHGAAHALRNSLGLPGGSEPGARGSRAYTFRVHDDPAVHHRDLEGARRAIGDEEFEAAFAEGTTSALSDALEDAVAAAAEVVTASEGTTGRSGPLVGLTPREAQVLALVAEGRSNKDIARELHISARTVENHLAHIYIKLGVQGRVGAALAAHACGLVAT